MWFRVFEAFVQWGKNIPTRYEISPLFTLIRTILYILLICVIEQTWEVSLVKVWKVVGTALSLGLREVWSAASGTPCRDHVLTPSASTWGTHLQRGVSPAPLCRCPRPGRNQTTLCQLVQNNILFLVVSIRFLGGLFMVQGVHKWTPGFWRPIQTLNENQRSMFNTCI